MKKKSLLILLALAFVLSACGAIQTADTVNNGATQNIVQEVIEPELDQVELSEKWLVPIMLEASLYGACKNGIAMAEEWQTQEVDSGTKDFSLSLLEAILIGVDEELIPWEAFEDQAAIKDLISQDYASVSVIIVDWINHETTSADVLPLFRELCPQVKGNVQLIVDAAKEDGLTQESLEEMGEGMVMELLGGE